MTKPIPHPEGYPIKLVRDRTPLALKVEGGGGLFYRRVTPVDAARALRQKLIEEVGEYLENPGVDELADVLAVVEGLAHLGHGFSLYDVADLAHTDERGGFTEGMMMYGYHRDFDGRAPGSTPSTEGER